MWTQAPYIISPGSVAECNRAQPGQQSKYGNVGGGSDRIGEAIMPGVAAKEGRLPTATGESNVLPWLVFTSRKLVACIGRKCY